MGRRNDGIVDRLALARAGRITISDWASQNGVAVRTAYNWASSPEFLAAVVKHRAVLAARTIEHMARQAARSTVADHGVRSGLDIADLVADAERRSAERRVSMVRDNDPAA